MIRVDLEAERAAWKRQRPIVEAAALSVLVGPKRVRQRAREQAQAAVESMPEGLRTQRAQLVAHNLGQLENWPTDEQRFSSIADEHVRREFARRAEQGIGAIWPLRSPDSIVGAEHLERAVAGGRGVVIWRMNFADPAPLNVALAELGHPAVHLSADDHHVIGDSVLSRRWWSTVSMRSEVRALCERVVFSPTAGGHGYLTTLRRHLAAGRVVTIVGDSRAGSRQIPVTVCGNRWHIPTGGASLAHVAGSPLLTAHVLDDDRGAASVVIGGPIEADRTDRRVFRARAAREFAARIEATMLAAPENRLTASTMRRRRVKQRAN